MVKVRVHQLAKDLGLANQDLVDKLQALGFAVKSHSSTVDEDDARRALSAGKPAVQVKEPSSPKKVSTVLRRRSHAEGDAAGEGPVEVAPLVEVAPPVEPEPPSVEIPVEAPVVAVEPVVEPPVAVAPVAEPVPVVVAPVTPPAPVVELAPVIDVVPVVVAPSTEPPRSAPIEPKRGPQRRGSPQVSKVVRVIDADAIKARLAADGKDFAARPRPSSSFPHVRELQVVPDQFGRGAPTMVDVSRDRTPAKKGKKGDQEIQLSRRDMLELRAGARDIWRTPGKKKKATKKGAKTEITQMAARKRIIEISGAITVGELARQMAIKAGEVLRKLMTMGMMVTINQTIDFDTASIIASEFEYEVKNVAFEETDLLVVGEDKPEDLLSRPPVVTIMGHVDHGKTSLLDAIRETSVAAGEAGGITQHIGAYSVKTARGMVTFLDTPGHEAFTAMRMRGAQVTDIVVLVVAADDGVMPQTVEAINHAKSAEVPIVVAINKIDKPEANPDRVMQALTEYGLVAEAWGGDTMSVRVSAKKKTGITELLDTILLQAEVLDLKANPSKPARGAIVEAQLDKGRGPVATVLIQEGTLHAGDSVVSGDFFGRVRAIYDGQGELLEAAGPAMPVQVVGLSGVPNAGDTIDCVPDEKTAKLIAEHRAQKKREQELLQTSKVSLETFLQRAKEGEEALELKLVIKADVQGSVEAVTDALRRLSTPRVKVAIVHSAVGAITGSDANLASTSGAVIIGFNVRPDAAALQVIEQTKVDVRMYSIIYEAVDGVLAAMEGRLPTTTVEKYLGRAEVRQIFNAPKIGTIAGCSVIDGKIMRSARIRLLRDSAVVHDGKLASLKRFKDDVREVAQGYECGMNLDGYNDVKPGDLIEAYELIEVATKLDGSTAARDSHAEA